jgi:sugar transferase (PEP-CTERM system associated)
VVARDRLLLVGASPLLEDIGKHIEEHPETGLQVVGYVGDREETGTALAGGKVLGPMASLREIIQATNPDRIVVGMTERRERMPVSELLELRFAGHIIEEAASTYEKVCGRMCLKELRPSQLIYTGELGPRRISLFYQMATNLILAAIGVVVAAPMMLLTALAVRLTSAGPVLYRQVRVGLDGRPFTLYKFRSMRANAEAETGAVWASKDDPRVTPLGRTLRKLRIDEIPQLFNVLKTEMSIVGPRPERPEMVQSLAQQIPYYRHRHCVRPGITGWAQVNYKYGDTLDDVMRKLEYDLYYIKNMSPSLDAYIIFLTIKATLLSRGSQ